MEGASHLCPAASSSASVSLLKNITKLASLFVLHECIITSHYVVTEVKFLVLYDYSSSAPSVLDVSLISSSLLYGTLARGSDLSW